jgi:hypothetical protein
MRDIVIALLCVLGTSPVWAEGMTIIQSSDGTAGTVMDLGNGQAIYSDSHGSSAALMDLGGGLRTFQFTSPSGPAQRGTVQSLGAVPQAVLPAPILPFSPHASPLLTPGEPKTPTVAPPSSGDLGTGFWRR